MCASMARRPFSRATREKGKKNGDMQPRVLAVVLAAASLPSLGYGEAAGNCRNPLFRMHWPTQGCVASCPSSLNSLPTSLKNLTVCKQWRGRAQCCNPGVEDTQVAAFDYRKLALGQQLVGMRAYVAQMMTRQMTVVYENAPEYSRSLFDKGLAALHDATRAYPKCMLAMLQYAAGMICFMCDPQWEDLLYRQDTSLANEGQEIFLANRLFRSVSISPDACEELWARCRLFGTRVKKARRAILESDVSKQIYAPLPDVEAYFDKSSLCNMVRTRFALHPFPETSLVTARPTMPSLPRDASTTQALDETVTISSARTLRDMTSPKLGKRPEEQDRRQLAEDAPISAKQSPLPVRGELYLVAAFHSPAEVRISRVDTVDRLEMSQKLGGEELGAVSSVAISSDLNGTADAQFAYLAVSTSAETQEIVQYGYTFLSGQLVLQSPVTVWPSKDFEQEALTHMRAVRGELYIATAKGRILKVGQDSLTTGARTDGEQLFTMMGEVEHSASYPITGFDVQAEICWSTATAVYMGPRGGLSAGPRRLVLTEQNLTAIVGSHATVKDLYFEQSSASGVGTVYLAIYFGGLKQYTSIYRFVVPGVITERSLVPLRWNSVEETLTLGGMTGLRQLFISTRLAIYKAPTDFQDEDSAEEIYSLSGSGVQTITDIGLYFVKGSDCEMSDWKTTGECSATCGDGTYKQERHMVSPPTNNGQPCPSETERFVHCNLLDCPKRTADCVMSQWINDGVCSKTCGGGELQQKRVALIQAADGGRPCPSDLTRTVSCNIATCGGIDYVVASMLSPQGMFSGKLEGRATGSQIKMTAFQSDAISSPSMPELMVTDSTNNVMYTANVGSKEVTQWYLQAGEAEHFSDHSPMSVWDGKNRTGGGAEVVAMAVDDSLLYLATDAGELIVLDKVGLVTRTLPAKSQLLYVFGTDSGHVRSLSISGTYVVWTTAHQITLGSIRGQDPSTDLQALVSPDSLRSITGSSASTEIMDAKLTADGKRVLFLVWDDGEEALGLYAVAVEEPGMAGTRPKQLRYTWTVRELRLVIVSPQLALVYGATCIWEVPADLDEGGTATVVYKPNTVIEISALSYAFVKGVDCNVTEWISLTACSASCGGGFIRQARQIISQPTHGGTPCPEELSREVVCNEVDCPVDCQVSPWANEGECSAECGGGLQLQTRSVVQEAHSGGAACPVLRRKVTCNPHPCAGIDCILTDWINYETCSKSCGTGDLRQYREIVRHDAYGGKPCSASVLHRVVPCNPTPCAGPGFDPIAEGKLTGFDFDIAEYCEHPDVCSTMQAYDIAGEYEADAADEDNLDFRASSGDHSRWSEERSSWTRNTATSLDLFKRQTNWLAAAAPALLILFACAWAWRSIGGPRTRPSAID